jgi:hypothetical protein
MLIRENQILKAKFFINFQSNCLLQENFYDSYIETRILFYFSSLTTTEEMLSVGLFLNDLNFYDGSSEILISGIQHTRQLQTAIDKVRVISDQFLSCFKGT